MRCSALAAAACLSLSALVATAYAALPAPATATASVSSEAAAKHAKRTACLKNAKAKKLVGAEKTSFLKGCNAAP